MVSKEEQKAFEKGMDYQTTLYEIHKICDELSGGVDQGGARTLIGFLNLKINNLEEIANQGLKDPNPHMTIEGFKKDLEHYKKRYSSE